MRPFATPTDLRATLPWSSAALPDLAGRRVVVTRATGGLDFEIATQLARAGADVTVTARDKQKGAALSARLAAAAPGGRFDLVLLDLADLQSVARAAEE